MTRKSLITRSCSPISTMPAKGKPFGASWRQICRPLSSKKWSETTYNPRLTNRAVSSGVEHCIHTAGVASSKLAPPTTIALNKKAKSFNLAFLLGVGCVEVSEHLTGEIGQPGALAARQRDVSAMRPAFETVHREGHP